MRVLIFGATGGTGRQLVSQALQRGHEVSAFVRTPARLDIVDPRLRVVQGDVERAESIHGAVPGHEAVLSALGVGETRGQLGPLYNWLFIPLLLRHAFADKERQEAIIRASSLDWTIVQPAALTNGPLTRRCRAGRRRGPTLSEDLAGGRGALHARGDREPPPYPAERAAVLLSPGRQARRVARRLETRK